MGKWTNEPCNGVDEVVNTFWVLTKFIRNISQPRKVSDRDIEEIQYVGMQSHGHTHGLQPEADDSSELLDVTHYR